MKIWRSLSRSWLKIKYTTTEVSTQFGEYIIGVGKKEFDIRSIGTMDGNSRYSSS